MIYPQKLNSRKSDIILKLAIAVSILVALILIIINKLTTPNIPWAALANSGIIYAWITVWYSINKNTNIAGHILIQGIAISCLTVYIDYKLGFRGWSISMSIPIIIMIANITMLVLTIVSHKKYIKYAIYQLFIVILSMLPVIFINENVISDKILSIIASGISIVNLLLTLILSISDVKEAVIRKLHM